MNANEIERAAGLLRGARRVCVSTGAGMSAESGVATFRDAGGLWSQFNPAELATPEAFARDPVNVWAWYRARRVQLGQVQPHAGHLVLARWEERQCGMQNVECGMRKLQHGYSKGVHSSFCILPSSLSEMTSP